MVRFWYDTWCCAEYVPCWHRRSRCTELVRLLNDTWSLLFTLTCTSSSVYSLSSVTFSIYSSEFVSPLRGLESAMDDWLEAWLRLLWVPHWIPSHSGLHHKASLQIKITCITWYFGMSSSSSLVLLSMTLHSIANEHLKLVLHSQIVTLTQVTWQSYWLAKLTLYNWIKLDCKREICNLQL